MELEDCSLLESREGEGSMSSEVMVDWIVADFMFRPVDSAIVEWIVADSVFCGTSLSVNGKYPTMSVREEGRRRRESGAVVCEGKGVALRSVDRCLVGLVGMVGVSLGTSEV